jgi:exopolyphosphatase / guanosine-5'-triphosphate,3'-diphosphate pyrophosphatase
MVAAIIDIGTNTFNLLVAEKAPSGSFKKLYARKIGVKLGAGLLPDGRISAEAINRGINALKEFAAEIAPYKPATVLGLATSAVRSASNGQEFKQRAAAEAGINVQIISGDKEAELIYLGNKLATDLNGPASLILDIGGGSNECIICSSKGALWKRSFDLGIFRIIKKFQPSYPMPSGLIDGMRRYFDAELAELWQACKEHKPVRLIGSSGSFDTFRSMISESRTCAAANSSSFAISIPELGSIYSSLIKMSLAEIADVPGIDPVRVEIISVASLFIWHIVEKTCPAEIIQSDYSMKEGALSAIFAGQDI